MILEISLLVVSVLAGALFMYLYDKVIKTADTNAALAKRIFAIEEENEELRKRIGDLETDPRSKD